MLRSSILRWMAVVAALGLNIGLVRAYAVAEMSGQHLDLFALGFLIFFALQFGTWCCWSTRGRRRRFWLGFVASGLAATAALGILSMTNDGFNERFVGAVSEL